MKTVPNNRLNNIYSEIIAKNSREVLNNHVRVDTNWNKPVYGITLQIPLSENVQDCIDQLQLTLSKMEPSALFFPPAESRHISLNQVIPWNEGTSDINQQAWRSLKIEFLPKLQNLNKHFKKFPIEFNRLVITTEAIIWCADDPDDNLQALRNDMYEHLPFPSSDKSLNIIHTTIARYKTPLQSPKKLLAFAKTQSRSIPMQIHSLHLNNERNFPSLLTHKIAAISAQ